MAAAQFPRITPSTVVEDLAARKQQNPKISIVAAFDSDKNKVNKIYHSIYTFHIDSIKNFIKEKYGGEPSIVYFHSPVVVDNLTREIIKD